MESRRGAPPRGLPEPARRRRSRWWLPAGLAMLVATGALVTAIFSHSAPPAGDTLAAGGKASLVDNRNGTITDLTTGLVWEKKCNCPETLHHYEATFFWSGDGEKQTIWDWIDRLNREGSKGFAAYDDWRIPNVKELLSLVDYERTDPAIAAPFGACATECASPAEPACGCTASGAYWTSTTFADFPAHALVVGFYNGSVDDQLKTLSGFVRAVRGPLPDTADEQATGAAPVSDGQA